MPADNLMFRHFSGISSSGVGKKNLSNLKSVSSVERSEINLLLEEIRDAKFVLKKKDDQSAKKIPDLHPLPLNNFRNFAINGMRAVGMGLSPVSNNTSPIFDSWGVLSGKPPSIISSQPPTADGSSTDYGTHRYDTTKPTQNLSQPASPNVNVGSHNTEVSLVRLGGKQNSKVPIRKIRQVEKVETNNIPVSTAADHLSGDLPVNKKSLLAARLLAIQALYKKLFGNAPDMNRENGQWLEIANRVHARAQENPTNEADVELSNNLLIAESKIWAKANGADQLGVSREQQNQAFHEAWSMALEPPEIPAFKTWKELEAEALAKIDKDGGLDFFKWRGGRGGKGNKQEFVKGKVTIQYYTQFHDYIKNHLDKLCAAKALASFQASELGSMWMEYRPDHAWIIEEITTQRIVGNRPASGAIGPKVESIPVKSTSSFSFIFRLSKNNSQDSSTDNVEDKFGFISPDGSFKLLDKTILSEDGSLNKLQVLLAHGINASSNEQDNNNRIGCPKSTDKPCHESKFSIKSGKIEDIPEYQDGVRRASIKEIMESNARKYILPAIEEWKENHYDSSMGEKIAKILVPFYKTIHKSSFDPGYQLKFADILTDSIELGIIIGTIGYSAIGQISFKAGMLAAQAMGSAKMIAKSSAVIRASLQGFKTKAVFIKAVNKFTNFSVPLMTRIDAAIVALRNKDELKNILNNILQSTDVQRTDALQRTDDPSPYNHHPPSFELTA